MTKDERIAELERKVEVLKQALAALLEQNYPYREARARTLLVGYERREVEADG